jgi:hypothetical protein
VEKKTITTCWPLRPSSPSISPIPHTTPGCLARTAPPLARHTTSHKTAPPPNQFPPRLPRVKSLGHTAPGRKKEIWPLLPLFARSLGRDGLGVEEEGWQPVRTGRLFQLHSNPVSPLGHPTSGSTPTNLPSFRPIVRNTRYRSASSLLRGWGCLKEEEEAGLKEGVGESGLGQVLATPVR